MTDTNTTQKQTFIEQTAPLVLQGLVASAGPNYNWPLLAQRALDAANALWAAVNNVAPQVPLDNNDVTDSDMQQ